MEPLFFGIITEPWQVYVAASVLLVAAAIGVWRGVVRANRADERKARTVQEINEA